MKILTTGTVERNSTDVAAAVKEIAAKDPQAVVMISAYKSCAAFIKEMPITQSTVPQRPGPEQVPKRGPVDIGRQR